MSNNTNLWTDGQNTIAIGLQVKGNHAGSPGLVISLPRKQDSFIPLTLQVNCLTLGHLLDYLQSHRNLTADILADAAKMYAGSGDYDEMLVCLQASLTFRPLTN
jgi:hypothetical protein